MVDSTDWYSVQKNEIKKLLEELHDLYDKARARSKEINTKDTEYNDKIRKIKAGAYADAYSYCIMRLRNLYFTGTVNGSERC